MTTQASAFDGDGDGYPTSGPPASDCDDGNAAISPNGQEVIANDIDEDCDGFDGVKRSLTVKEFPALSWTWAGAVSQTDGRIKVGSSVVNAEASVKKLYSMTIPRGRVHAVLGVTANPWSTPGCKLRLRTSAVGASTSSWAEWTITGNSTGTLTTGDLGATAAPRVLKEVQISCGNYGSVTVDWLTLQNTSDAIPPAAEATLAWQDLGMAGGGSTNPIIRASQSSSVLSDYLFGGSDVGGIAIKDVALDTPWTPISGSGSTALTSQPELAIWDILGASWDSVYIVTGRDDDFEYISGGLYRGEIGTSGEWEWEELVDSYDGNGTGVNIGAMGRYSACTGAGSDKEAAGGRLLVEETDSTGVYIANHQTGYRGLDYWDDLGDTACELAAGDLPDDPIGAIARVESSPNREPGLLVGIRVRTANDPALYLCTLPQQAVDSDLDGFHNDVGLTCGVNNNSVDCQPIAWTEGVDVRDIEVDPNDPSIAYIAVGGDDPAGATCEDGEGGIYEVLIDELAGVPYADAPVDVSAGITDIVTPVDVTGVSMDPEGDFLYAFLPVGHGSAYNRDRIYRIAAADIGTTAWVALNGDDADEPLREANLDYTDGWLGAASIVKPRPNPAWYAPSWGVDATWYLANGASYDPYNGWAYTAVIPSNYNAWSVTGLDTVTWSGPYAGWDGDSMTEWAFWPETAGDQVWQTTAANDVAVDEAGNVWTAVSDLGLFQSIPDATGDYYGELDCLWGGLPAGAVQVDAVEGAVWATFYDQGVAADSDDCDTCDIPHSIAVARTLGGATVDYGLTWEYMGAALDTAGHYAAIFPDPNIDGLVCADDALDHYALPFGDGLGDEGNAFAEPQSEDPYSASWGQPMALDAFSEDIALVGFRTYDYDDGMGSIPVDGRVGYTLDGGVTWESVPFKADFTSTLATGLACAAYHDCLCDENEFFAKVNSIALLQQTDRSYYDSASDWRLEFFVSSQYNQSSVEEDHCALARVILDPNVVDANGDLDPTWIWYGLDDGNHYPACTLDGDILGGVSTSRWGTDAYIWGQYAYTPGSNKHFGGACTASIDSANTYTQVVSATDWQFGIGSVAAHPYVSDLIAIAPQQTAATWGNCKKSGAGDCPDKPRLLLGERTGTTWTLTQTAATAPNSNATALEWTPMDDPGLVMSTGGAGGWKGVLSWQ